MAALEEQERQKSLAAQQAPAAGSPMAGPLAFAQPQSQGGQQVIAPPQENDLGAAMGDHYAYHGRDEHGQLPKRQRSTGEKILRGFHRGLLGLAAANGNTMAQYQLREIAEGRQTRQKAEQEFAEHNRLARLMMSEGMSMQEAEMALLDPKAFGTEFSTRYRTREVSEGEGVFTPSFRQGERPQAFYNPKTFENGPDIVEYDRNTGSSRVVHQGMVAAEQEARALGLRPGTPDFDTYIRDNTLGAQGPTATGLARDRIATERRGQDMSDRRTRDGWNRPRPAPAQRQVTPTPSNVIGSIMQKMATGQPVTPQERQLYDQHRQPRSARRSAPGRAGNGAVIVNPRTGQRMRLQNGQWVPI